MKTIRVLAAEMNVGYRTLCRDIKATFPDLMKNGSTTYIDDNQEVILRSHYVKVRGTGSVVKTNLDNLDNLDREGSNLDREGSNLDKKNSTLTAKNPNLDTHLDKTVTDGVTEAKKGVTDDKVLSQIVTDENKGKKGFDLNGVDCSRFTVEEMLKMAKKGKLKFSKEMLETLEEICEDF